MAGSGTLGIHDLPFVLRRLPSAPSSTAPAWFPNPPFRGLGSLRNLSYTTLMAKKLKRDTTVWIKYYHTNYYHLKINQGKPFLIKTPFSSGPLTYRTLEKVLAEIVPADLAYAEYVWDVVAAGKPTPIWEITLTGAEILDAIAVAKGEVVFPDWDLMEDGLLGAPKFLLEREYGEEVLGRFTTPDALLYVGYDNHSMVLWAAWARLNGTTFTDVASRALLSVAKPGGHWEGVPPVVKPPKKGHLAIGALDADIAFIHYDKNAAGKVEDGFYGAQTTGRHRLIAYRKDYPFDPAATYPWQM